MRKLSVVALSLIVCAVMASSAGAANIIVGLQLGAGTWADGGAETEPFLLTNATLPDPGAHVVSPVDGVIVSWQVREAEGTGFQLYTLRHGLETTYTVTGTSGAHNPAGTGLERFPAALPIAAGEAIGLMVPSGSSVGLGQAMNEIVYWQPALALGATAAGTGSTAFTYAFAAEVQPAPAISLLGTTAGPAAGGTVVQIAGTDFEGTRSVTFGGVPASFVLDSDGLITATSPPGTGTVAITVTTAAGPGTAAQQFTYQSPTTTVTSGPPTPVTVAPRICIVPKLTGRSLKASKKKIRAATCKVGKVRRRKGATAASGKVVGQSRKPGTRVPAGTTVTVTLGSG